MTHDVYCRVSNKSSSVALRILVEKKYFKKELKPQRGERKGLLMGNFIFFFLIQFNSISTVVNIWLYTVTPIWDFYTHFNH